MVQPSHLGEFRSDLPDHDGETLAICSVAESLLCKVSEAVRHALVQSLSSGAESDTIVREGQFVEVFPHMEIRFSKVARP